MKLYSIPSNSFGRLLSEALVIGHFVSRTNSNILACTQEHICNSFILETLAQELPISNSSIHRKLYNFLIRIKFRFLILNHDDIFGEHDFFYQLMEAQRKYRERLLTLNHSIKFTKLVEFKSRPIILFATRTNDYWNSKNEKLESGLDLRNSSIDWTEAVIGMLIENNFSVIRIGAERSAALSIRSNFFFDYSLSEMRSEKSDFEMCNHADFAVTTGGGISLLPSLMGVPSLMVNTGLFSDLQPQEFLSHYLPKSVYSIVDDRPLTTFELSELDLCFMQRDSHYSSKGLEIRDVTPEDALMAVKHFSEIVARRASLQSSSSFKKGNFMEIPEILRDRFPANIKLPESGLAIGIKVSKLWKNLQSN